MADKKGNEFATVTSDDGRLVPASLVTKPLVRPDAEQVKPAKDLKGCIGKSLPDCFKENTEVFKEQEEKANRSKVTTRLDGDLDERLADLAMPTCLD